MNDYQKEAKDFCAKYNVKIISVYTGHRKYWPDDKTARACFSVTISREGKSYTFDFGQSLRDSYQAQVGFNDEPGYLAWRSVPQWFKFDKYPLPVTSTGTEETRVKIGGKMKRVVIRQLISQPTEYDIFAAVTKNDPGTFDNFCADYGYDTDSKKAEQIYFAVQKEWSNIVRLFADCMEELQEIS